MSNPDFNQLLHGDALTAACIVGERELDESELRAALANALTRISVLERETELNRQALVRLNGGPIEPQRAKAGASR